MTVKCRASSLAMIMCVQDEELFLAANLAYHHLLGVERAYVYLDRCGPATRSILARFAWVCPIDRPCREEHLVLHQMACADDALQRARAEGFEWLLHLDADEFAMADLADRLDDTVGSLPAKLADVSAGTVMVRFRTREVVPLRGMEKEPFWKLVYFQSGGVIERDLLDPCTGEMKRLRRWLGHDRGKSAVRTTADVQAADSHEWTENQRRPLPRKIPLPSEDHGFCHHFVVVSAEHWQEKYRKLAQVDPPNWPRGRPVDFPKQSWKEASLRMSRVEAERYFDRWVALPADQLAPYLKEGIVIEERAVDRILTQIDTDCGHPESGR
jgi:hypothetical protein